VVKKPAGGGRDNRGARPDPRAMAKAKEAPVANNALAAAFAKATKR
jgi:protein Tex